MYVQLHIEVIPASKFERFVSSMIDSITDISCAPKLFVPNTNKS